MGTEHPDYGAEFARAATRLPIQRQDLSALWVLVAVLALMALESHAGGRQCSGPKPSEAALFTEPPDPMRKPDSADDRQAHPE